MLSLRFPRGGPRTATSGPPPWLAFIHAANRIEPGLFGEPVSVGPGDVGDYVERYADARVTFPGDDPITVRITATTERGDRVLKAAAEEMGWLPVVNYLEEKEDK